MLERVHDHASPTAPRPRRTKRAERTQFPLCFQQPRPKNQPTQCARLTKCGLLAVPPPWVVWNPVLASKQIGRNRTRAVVA